MICAVNTTSAQSITKNIKTAQSIIHWSQWENAEDSDFIQFIQLEKVDSFYKPCIDIGPHLLIDWESIYNLFKKNQHLQAKWTE